MFILESQGYGLKTRYKQLKEPTEDRIYGGRWMSANFIDNSDIYGKRIIDIGCGEGWFIRYALNNGALYVSGIEPNNIAVKNTELKIQNSRASVHLGSAIQLPFNDRTFDTATAWEVLEHIQKDAEGQMFSEAYRILKEGSIFYLSTPHISLASITDPARLFGHRHYKSEQIMKYAEDSGFVVERVEVWGGWWCVMAMLNMYFSKWVLGRKPIAESTFSRKQEFECKDKGFFTIYMKCRK